MAVTYPSAPLAVDYRVAPNWVRYIPVADAGALQTALNNVQYGDWIVLTAGVTYQGQFVLKPAVGGTLAGVGGDNWITITTSAWASLPPTGTRVGPSDAVNMPTILAFPTNIQSAAMSVQSNVVDHYRLVGLRFTTPQLKLIREVLTISPGAGQTFDYANYPNHVAVQHCIFEPDYDFGPFKTITIAGSDVVFRDNFCRHGMQMSQGDCNLFLNIWGKGPYLFQNNYMAGMGEVWFMGSTTLLGPVVRQGVENSGPQDVTFVDNHVLHETRYHRYHPDYIPAVDTIGAGLLSSNGTTCTFDTAQTFPPAKYTTFQRAHTTTALTPTSTRVDIGADPRTLGFTIKDWGSAWLGGEDFFHYTGYDAGGFTGVSGITSSWPTGTWVADRQIFLRPNDNSQASNRITDWISDTQVQTKVAFSPPLAGVQWRYNCFDFFCKQVIETKNMQRMLVARNVFENGFIDGQSPIGGGEWLPREGGIIADIEWRDNKFLNTSSLAGGVGSPQSGVGYYLPTPRSGARIWVHNNLFEHIGDPATAGTIGVIPRYIFGWSLNNTTYGQFGPAWGGTIGINDGTKGTGRIVTHANGTTGLFILHPSLPQLYTGLDLSYQGGGYARVTNVLSATQMEVEVLTAFPAAAIGVGTQPVTWNIGPTDLIGTRYKSDSVIFEHNTAAGVNTVAVFSLYFSIDEGLPYEPIQQCTNFIVRDNVLYHGNGTSAGGGMVGNINSTNRVGTNNWASSYLDPATKIIAKNAFFGLNCRLFANSYAAGEVNMHDPDYNGGASGGPVGFVDYANGDYSLTGTYATDATSAPAIPMRGCNFTGLAAIWASAVSGTPVSSGGAGPAAGTQDMALVGGGPIMNLAMTPATP